MTPTNPHGGGGGLRGNDEADRCARKGAENALSQPEPIMALHIAWHKRLLPGSFQTNTKDSETTDRIKDA